jgi:hypothetical protein
MFSMRVVSRSVFFLILGATLVGCGWRPVVRSNEGTIQPKIESVEETIPAEVLVEFEGVSFTYDPRVFGNVKHEVVPEYRLEEPDHKPDGVAPEHVRFEFEFGREFSKAQIEVYPLDQFPIVYSVNPDSVEYTKKDVAALQKVIKNPAYRLDGGIPRLPFEDVGISFYARVREFDFQEGDGVIFVTHWTQGADLVSNINLLYRFEGITADGKYYVTAETPVSVAFLPDTWPEEFEGYTYDNLWGPNSNKHAGKFEKYRKSITDRLERLGPNEFGPALEKFESIITSLKITR